jgi:ketosteroid isomerase-like protein
LREDYQDTNGLKGQSSSIYDASKRVWRQTWVTNRGQMLVLEGGIQAGEMVLSGVDHTADGEERHVRGTWKPVNEGVRETAMTSIDGGKTWKPWFDLLFRPVARAVNNAATSATDDEGKIVIALDIRYQAAVRRNDADAMDPILADDFVLVTGSGKTYTKADLLKEARGRRAYYERQDDAEQTVRVWGDTAVVTAKLWEKGTENAKPFDHTLWFSDTYVRTPDGWRYVFGQASLPLSKDSSVTNK